MFGWCVFVRINILVYPLDRTSYKVPAVAYFIIWNRSQRLMHPTNQTLLEFNGETRGRRPHHTAAAHLNKVTICITQMYVCSRDLHQIRTKYMYVYKMSYVVCVLYAPLVCVLHLL